MDSSNLITDPVTGAHKCDYGKPRLDLIPPIALLETARVFNYGALKYGVRNWDAGMDWSRLYGAIQRHLNAWWAGQNIDSESGLSHLSHASATLLMLLFYSFTNRGKDDRLL